MISLLWTANSFTDISSTSNEGVSTVNMDMYQKLMTTIALLMGTAWASGINLYATIGVLGILGLTGNINLPESLLVVKDPLVIGDAAIM